MVRGLVEQQRVVAHEDQLAHHEPGALAAGEGAGRLLAEQQGVSHEAFAPKSEKEKKSHPTTPEFTATPLR